MAMTTAVSLSAAQRRNTGLRRSLGESARTTARVASAAWRGANAGRRMRKRRKLPRRTAGGECRAAYARVKAKVTRAANAGLADKHGKILRKIQHTLFRGICSEADQPRNEFSKQKYLVFYVLFLHCGA